MEALCSCALQWLGWELFHCVSYALYWRITSTPHAGGLRSAGYRGLKPVVAPPESITVWTNASPLSPAALPNVNPASDSVVGGERPKSLISPPAPQATRETGAHRSPTPSSRKSPSALGPASRCRLGSLPWAQPPR
ncbi:unnamed protein product [Lepidochelys kempii]